MLSEVKPSFKQDIHDILQKSMYEAFMCNFKGSGDEVIDQYTHKKVEEMSNMISKKFADTATDGLINSIDKYIKSIGVFINVTPAGIALTGPTGPVTGTITITPSTSIINIK